MKILLTGASGLIGSALKPALVAAGHQVVELTRQRAESTGQIRWDFVSPLPLEALSGVDALIHLAGRSVASGYWTAQTRREIHDSRVSSTLQLAAALGQVTKSNFTFICASAVGWYGDRGSVELNESAPAGDGFLAETCRAWEAAANSAASASIRTLNARFGVVLSARGGALKQMLMPFRLGLGAVLGNGKQFMPWISLNDAVRALLFCLEHRDISGPVNFTAPQSVTNTEFSAALSAHFNQPLRFRAPSWALKLLLGKKAEELLLASCRAAPRKLLEAGFTFEQRDLQSALDNS